jgi:hypothetical protein
VKRDREESRKAAKRAGKHKPSKRLFPWAVDKVAFIDKIALSVDGQLKPNFEEELQHPESRGILAPDSLYSRAVSGTFWLSGNPIEVIYGKTKHFKNVSALRIAMQSENRPLTAAEVMLLVKRLTATPPEIRVSQLEFTFDVTGATIDYVLWHIIYRARNEARLWSGKTIYVGSPRSAWEVRIYEKTLAVLRLEFILRRAFLSRWKINRPEDVLTLRKLNVWDLLSVRRFSVSSAARVTRTWNNTIGMELVRTWGEYRRPLRLLPRILKNHGAHPQQVLRRTRLQKKMEDMQKRFLW